MSTIGTDIFPMAGDVFLLIENNQVTDEMIDSLYLFFQNAIQQTKNTREKMKLEKWLSVLQKIKEIEDQNKIQDQKDIDDLDSILSQI